MLNKIRVEIITKVAIFPKLLSKKMKKFVLILITFISTLIYSQDDELKVKLIEEIEISKFTDSVTTSALFQVKHKPVEVKGYLKGDTLLKSIAIFSEFNKILHTYYDKSTKMPIYVKVVDSSSNKIVREVYVLGYHRYKTLNKSKEDVENDDIKLIIEHSDFSGEIGFALVERQAYKYKFIGKLLEKVTMTPNCGREAFAIVHKYKVLSTDFPNYKQNYVLLIQTCPEFNGKNFFQKNKIYEIDVSTNSGVTFNYTIFNEYEKDDLPIFWVEDIVQKK